MKNFNRVFGESVTGLDCSTNSIAFCTMRQGAPTTWGEIKLNGADIYEKIHDAKLKVGQLSDSLDSDAIALEAAIMVRSPHTAISLAYVYGAVLGELMDTNKHVFDIAPISWQSLIGNKLWTKAEKDQIKSDFPGRSPSWYTNKMRQMRKQRTIDWVFDTYRVNLSSDNVADAFGLAYYADRKLITYEEPV